MRLKRDMLWSSLAVACVEMEDGRSDATGTHCIGPPRRPLSPA